MRRNKNKCILAKPRTFNHTPNSMLSNCLLGIVVWISFILGLINIFKAAGSSFHFDLFASGMGIWLIAGFSGLIMCWVGQLIYRIRHS